MLNRLVKLIGKAFVPLNRVIEVIWARAGEVRVAKEEARSSFLMVLSLVFLCFVDSWCVGSRVRVLVSLWSSSA